MVRYLDPRRLGAGFWEQVAATYIATGWIASFVGLALGYIYAFRHFGALVGYFLGWVFGAAGAIICGALWPIVLILWLRSL